MLPIYEYNGTLAGNILENTDVINALTSSDKTKPLSAAQGKLLATWEVKRITVNGITCNFYKNNHLVICILQSTAELSNNESFDNMIPSGYNPKDLTCMNIIETSGSTIMGQARFTFYPDLSRIGLSTTSGLYVERTGAIAYYVD